MTPSWDYDAIVIGGGPAGSAAARQLARRGRRVLLVERRRFPRFHIGEPAPVTYQVPRARLDQILLDAVFAPGRVRPLAGDWRPSLVNRLRLEVFFAVVAAQRFVPLAPRSHSGC